MSRTDHHRPWQIRAADRIDVKKNNPAYVHHYESDHARYGQCRDCGWTLPHPVLSQPPHDYVRGVWYGPERQRERTGLARMAREFNTYGELLDGDFANHHHRHSAHSLWC